MSDCRKCARFEECAVDEDCGLFVDKPMTNADLIRAMSDGELAFLIGNGCPPERVKPCRTYLSVHGETNCADCWLDWLKSPVEVEE